MPKDSETALSGKSEEPSESARATEPYTKEEIADAIDALRQDQNMMNYLWATSRGMWRHENPVHLIEEAFHKITRSDPGTLSKAVPFFKTVHHNMDLIAIDWARARARRNPQRSGPGCLHNKSALLSRASAGVRLPRGAEAG